MIYTRILNSLFPLHPPLFCAPPSFIYRLKAGLKKKSKLQPKSSSKRELDKYYDMPHSQFHRLHSNDMVLVSHKYTLSDCFIHGSTLCIYCFITTMIYVTTVILHMIVYLCFAYDNIIYMTSLTYFMKFVWKHSSCHVTTCLCCGQFV